MKKTITVIIISLLCLSSFSILVPRAKTETEVIALPAGAWYPPGRHPDSIDSSRLDRIDSDMVTPGDQQIVTVEPGEAVTIDYSAWLHGNPGEIRQFWFVYSWASSYPPWDAYTPVYNGQPYPSKTVANSFSINTPTTPGTYKVWLCVESHYSMNQAVATCTEEPTMLPHAKIVVSEEADAISNGGFEDDLTDWTLNIHGSPYAEVTSELVHSGTKSFTISSSLSDGAHIWQLIDYPSTSYEFGFWVYRTSSDSRTMIILMKKEPWLSGQTGYADVCSSFYVNGSKIGVEAWDYISGSGWQYHKNIKWLDTSLEPNQWHKIAFIADGEAKKQSVYLDDDLIAELTTTGSWKPEVVIVGDGSTNDLWGTFYFDDVKLAEARSYILHVESAAPLSGISIHYSGDYGGFETTNFDIGPKAYPFVVTLSTAAEIGLYDFSYWQLDGTKMDGGNEVIVNVDETNAARTCVAVYVRSNRLDPERYKPHAYFDNGNTLPYGLVGWGTAPDLPTKVYYTDTYYSGDYRIIGYWFYWEYDYHWWPTGLVLHTPQQNPWRLQQKVHDWEPVYVIVDEEGYIKEVLWRLHYQWFSYDVTGAAGLLNPYSGDAEGGHHIMLWFTIASHTPLSWYFSEALLPLTSLALVWAGASGVPGKLSAPPLYAYKEFGMDYSMERWDEDGALGLGFSAGDLKYIDDGSTAYHEFVSTGAISSITALLFEVHSPASLCLTDPLGRHSGIDPSTGQMVNEIPETVFLNLGTEGQAIYILGGLNGTYDLRLLGTGSGPLMLNSTSLTNNGAFTQAHNATITKGQVLTTEINASIASLTSFAPARLSVSTLATKLSLAESARIQIQWLRVTVGELNLTESLADSMIGKLDFATENMEQAIHWIGLNDQSQTDQELILTKDALSDFVQQLNNEKGKGVPASDADALSANTKVIIEDLGSMITPPPWWVQYQLWIIGGVAAAVVLSAFTVVFVRKRKRLKA